MTLRFPPRVDHVHPFELGGRAAVAHAVDLPGLSFAVEERSADRVARLAADRFHRVPEVRGADLVGHVLEHPGDLAALDLIEDLPAELRVVALLVDREGAVADDRDPLVGRRDQVLPLFVFPAREQRYVRRTRSRVSGPASPACRTAISAWAPVRAWSDSRSRFPL